MEDLVRRSCINSRGATDHYADSPSIYPPFYLYLKTHP